MAKTNRFRIPYAVTGILTALLLQAGMTLPAFAQEVHHFDIDTTDAATAIHQFGSQSGVQILASAEVLNGKQLNKISGDLSTHDGFQKLLAGTGLSPRYVGERAVALVPETPVARTDSSETRSVPQADEVGTRVSEGKEGFWSRFRLAQADTTSKADTSSRSEEQKTSENSPGNSEKRTALEAVIVTATKRAKNIQDVPLSIAVVGADEIDRRGLVSSENYLRGIPGVTQTIDRIGQTITIRGIETSTTAQNAFSGATVATYFGETSITSSGGLAGNTSVDPKLVDIERVEVLRGPQGTTFGNSSLGGAVRTIPVAPNLDRFEGKVAAGYSFTSGTGGDNYNVEAVGNIPIIKDKLAIRATAYQFEESGFYRNRAGSDAAFLAAIAPYGAEAFAVNDDNVGNEKFTGGRIAALFQASDDLKFTLTYLTQTTEVDGQALANTGTYEQALLQVAPEHAFRGERAGVSDSDIDLANATIEYNLGWADLVATYSYVKGGSTFTVPFTVFGLPWPLSAGGPSTQRAHSDEIRLATKLDGAWNFLGGLYIEKLEDEFPQDFYWHGDPATNFFTPGERFLGFLLDRRTLKQKAAFGEASWELLPRLTLTGGIRAYDYERTARSDSTGFFFGDTATTLNSDASGTNFRGNLSYKPTDDALLYAGWAQGFRLGRPQPGVPPGLCDLNGDGVIDGTSTTIESTKSVDSDSVDSYELGGKVALLDRRLMLESSVFRIDWSKVPVIVLVPCGDVNAAYLANAGAARSEGVEFQAKFQITESFRVDLGGSWIDAKLTEDVPAQGLSSGDRLPGSPEFNANLGLQYEFNIAGYKAFLRGDSIYVGPFHGDLQESPETKAGGYVKLDVSARVTINNFNLDLFARNATNADDFTFHGNAPGSYGHRLRPRTIGLQLGYTF